ncbi:hypothetical protein [Aquihabitans sp. McL0605]|uniref:hypothetical protein n=1 Tax=Aquihabitans sp. McL0605 TaxID=3415671 RepID=UPI003CF15070
MRLPDRIWVPGLAALLLALVFVGALLVRADRDPSVLVHAGPPWTSAEGARGSLTVQDADAAFDGQFFYRIGLAPWSTAKTVDGVTFDLPSLRNARWGYGALAWVASGGDPDLVPWALIGLNLVAAAAVGAIGGGLARSADRHAAWGLLLFLWPGFAYSLSLDTSELVAASFLLGALLALRHRRWVATGLLLCAAVLTRDTTTVVPFAVVLAGLWAGRGDDEVRRSALPQVLAGGTALAVFGGWQLLQRDRFGALPLSSSGDNNLTAPLSGLVDQLTKVVPPSGGTEAFRLLSILGLIALVAAAGWALWRTRRMWLDAERIAWLGAVAVVLLLNAYLWSGATAFMRAATEAGLLSTLLLIRAAPRRLLVTAGIGLGGLWVLTVVAQLGKVG